jgi:thioredoxin reductase (NADPH)
VGSGNKGNSQDVLLDVIILGAGPAGISCALELNESKINFLVIDRKSSAGGQLTEIPSPIQNLAAGWFDNGTAVQESLQDAAKRAGLNHSANETIIECDLSNKTLRSETQTYNAKTLFLATGYRVKQLPESDDVKKFSKDIVYRSGTLHDDFVDKDVVVIGGGDSAVYEALDRIKSARKVTVVNRSSNFRASAFILSEAREDKRIHWMEGFEIESMFGQDKLQEIALRSTTDGTTVRLPADKLIVKIGYVPNTEIFTGQIDMDSSGHIRIGSDCSTSIQGVFAGGDMVTPGFDRIAVAMGHGTIAAKAICEYLRNTNRRQDLHTCGLDTTIK